ncbi:helix-turn-helix domain-containing protein [Actinomadura fibrosa]|uniref:Helix-turn-helix domain-containing protein n=1 Tax=Actinomadura fibrosa TaxID=111802 RepID=A0ABW2XPN6_9ACTN|nr:helix-turn-helix transcriptional regulator [Actinomadura fibrosa]
MDDARYGPIELPTRAWALDDVRAALTSRDVSAILRAAQQHAGVTQSRLAIATGLGQGRTNEIVNGRRTVVRLDVFERIADGLTMPDHARALLGLAPRRAAEAPAVTGHAEIATVYPSQADVAREMRQRAATASAVDILAVRVLGLVALNDSLLRGPLTGRDTPVDVRVLLLDPDAPSAVVRAEEITESVESFAAGTRLSLARLAELYTHPRVRLEVRLYDELPTWRMVAFDDVLFLSAFSAAHEGHRSGGYKLTASEDGVLHAGFRRQYDDMWRRARRPGKGHDW